MAHKLVGVDEVGRGCWAGPLVAGAVILGKADIGGLKDSKELGKAQREGLAALIERNAYATALGWASSLEVDELGLSEATSLAMGRALELIKCRYDEVIIDGKFNFLADNPKCRAVIKADNSVSAVSAASIIAKVARDEHMRKLATDYPEYGFDRHVGYGTKLHIEMLRKHGACKLHRMSYKPVGVLG